MLRSIVVPLDGSTFGEHALPHACALATRSGAMLRLVHVHTLSASPIHVAGYPVLDENWRSLHQEHERRYLEQIRTRLAALLPALVIEVAAYDRPVESLASESVGTFLSGQIAALADVDLIVMTTHGRGGLTRFWLGSVADTLVRTSNVPLLLVRPQEGTVDFAQWPPYQKLLIPLDGSALAEQILTPALTIGTLLAAEATLLRVVEPLYPVYNALAATNELDETALQAAQHYLQQLQQRLAAEGHPVQIQTLLATPPAQTILEQEDKYDLLALATHGRSELQRLMVGSVADKVLRGATKPVLIYCPR